MQDLTLEEAIEFTAYGDLAAQAQRWLSIQAQQNFIQTINLRERLFPIYGKLRIGNALKRIDGLLLYSFKTISKKTAAGAYGLKEYGYNEADEYINLTKIRDRNGRPIKMLEVVFSEGSGFITPDITPSFNPSLIFGAGSFLCYTDIQIPCTDFMNAFPQIDIEIWRAIVEAGTTEEKPPFFNGDGENNISLKRGYYLPIKTGDQIKQEVKAGKGEAMKETTENQNNQNSDLIIKSAEIEALKSENERLKAEIAALKNNPPAAEVGYTLPNGYTTEFLDVIFETARAGFSFDGKTKKEAIKNELINTAKRKGLYGSNQISNANINAMAQICRKLERKKGGLFKIK